MKKVIIPSFEMDFEGNIIYPPEEKTEKPIISPEDRELDYLEWNFESNKERFLL